MATNDRHFPTIGRKMAAVRDDVEDPSTHSATTKAQRDAFIDEFAQLVERAYQEVAMAAIYGTPYWANGLDVVGTREDGSPIYGEIVVDTP